MAVITVDAEVSPRIITVLAPDAAISIQELVNLIRDWEDSVEGMIYDHIASAAGKEALGSGVTVGITLTLLNAKLAFEARPGPSFVQCNISGGNLVAVDENGDEIDPIQTTAFTQIVRTSSSSATLQELADIQHSSFNGHVTIDVVNGVAGTAFPIGTHRMPVNNLTDAVTIADSRGFDTFFIIGNLSIGDTIISPNKKFEGQSELKTTITIADGANVADSEYLNAHVTGALDGIVHASTCKIKDATDLAGIFRGCILQGNLTVAVGQTALFIECTGGEPEITPINQASIDFNGSGQTISLRNFNGRATLTNKSGSEVVIIDLNSGHIIVDSTVTNGLIRVRGVGKVDDNSTGTAVVDITDLVRGEMIDELYKIHGLRTDSPLSVNTTSRTANSISQTINEAGGTVTVTRV